MTLTIQNISSISSKEAEIQLDPDPVREFFGAIWLLFQRKIRIIQLLYTIMWYLQPKNKRIVRLGTFEWIQMEKQSPEWLRTGILVQENIWRGIE